MTVTEITPMITITLYNPRGPMSYRALVGSVSRWTLCAGGKFADGRG